MLAHNCGTCFSSPQISFSQTWLFVFSDFIVPGLYDKENVWPSLAVCVKWKLWQCESVEYCPSSHKLWQMTVFLSFQLHCPFARKATMSSFCLQKRRHWKTFCDHFRILANLCMVPTQHTDDPKVHLGAGKLAWTEFRSYWTLSVAVPIHMPDSIVSLVPFTFSWGTLVIPPVGDLTKVRVSCSSEDSQIIQNLCLFFRVIKFKKEEMSSAEPTVVIDVCSRCLNLGITEISGYFFLTHSITQPHTRLHSLPLSLTLPDSLSLSLSLSLSSKDPSSSRGNKLPEFTCKHCGVNIVQHKTRAADSGGFCCRWLIASVTWTSAEYTKLPCVWPRIKLLIFVPKPWYAQDELIPRTLAVPLQQVIWRLKPTSFVPSTDYYEKTLFRSYLFSFRCTHKQTIDHPLITTRIGGTQFTGNHFLWSIYPIQKNWKRGDPGCVQKRLMWMCFLLRSQHLLSESPCFPAFLFSTFIHNHHCLGSSCHSASFLHRDWKSTNCLNK